MRQARVSLAPCQCAIILGRFNSQKNAAVKKAHMTTDKRVKNRICFS